MDGLLRRRMMAAKHEQRSLSESVPSERLALCTVIIQPLLNGNGHICVFVPAQLLYTELSRLMTFILMKHHRVKYSPFLILQVSIQDVSRGSVCSFTGWSILPFQVLLVWNLYSTWRRKSAALIWNSAPSVLRNCTENFQSSIFLSCVWRK